MAHAAPHYRVRLARSSELAAVQMIEQAASWLFTATDYAYLAGGEPLPEETLRDGVGEKRLWVAANAADTPVGFALALRLPQSAHLHELDVHPDHGRRGLGRRLIDAVIDWARSNNLPAVTLSTFADIAWNAPYYARLGFRAIGEDALSDELRDLRAREAAAGLPIARRVCMELVI